MNSRTFSGIAGCQVNLATCQRFSPSFQRQFRLHPYSVLFRIPFPVFRLVPFFIICTFIIIIMSSLRNSLHRRNHKERSQLAHRSRLGILEKHKDYVLRARDYHSKQDRIQRLRQKAADRNKDEFYFSMTKQRTEVFANLREHSVQCR